MPAPISFGAQRSRPAPERAGDPRERVTRPESRRMGDHGRHPDEQASGSHPEEPATRGRNQTSGRPRSASRRAGDPWPASRRAGDPWPAASERATRGRHPDEQARGSHPEEPATRRSESRRAGNPRMASRPKATHGRHPGERTRARSAGDRATHGGHPDDRHQSTSTAIDAGGDPRGTCPGGPPTAPRRPGGQAATPHSDRDRARW